MAKRTTDGLTRREREIMNAVFALGNRATADEIRARLSNPPGDSSVRVMLTRLEEKGYLRHQQVGLRYVYSATISPAAAKRAALQQYLQTFFGGSLPQMMTALVRDGSWSDEDVTDVASSQRLDARAASGYERSCGPGRQRPRPAQAPRPSGCLWLPIRARPYLQPGP